MGKLSSRKNNVIVECGMAGKKGYSTGLIATNKPESNVIKF